MDTKSFTNYGREGGQAWGVIRSEKSENHKNSTHTKIKFYIIFIFFSKTDTNIFTYGERSGCVTLTAGCVTLTDNAQGALSVQKKMWKSQNRTHTKIKLYIIFI